MGKQFTLTTTDKHSLGAYRADPAGTPKGGMVVVQEIFGVNHHVRAICDRLAALGYVAVAPAVFDRFGRNFESGYTPDEIAPGKPACKAARISRLPARSSVATTRSCRERICPM